MSPKETTTTATTAANIVNKEKKEKEPIWTSDLIPALALVFGYLVLMKHFTVDFLAEAETDPFKRLPFTGPLVFTGIYLLGITLGPRFMKNREPLKIGSYVFIYNVYQCIFNIWSVYAMITEVRTNPWFKSWWGNTPQAMTGGFAISYFVWQHYNNKYLELLDTLFMVLRKKNEQVSFLHCYHHILLIWAWFFCIKVESGGDCYFGATVNSFIHIIMYGYYTMALMGIPCPWKQWITSCQMIQFCAVLGHSIYVIKEGNMPISLPLAQGFVMINMLVLFGNFYIKSYMSKGKKKDDKKVAKTE